MTSNDEKQQPTTSAGKRSPLCSTFSDDSTFVIATASGNNESAQLALFVGIDEYQMLPRNRVDDAKDDPLVPLLEMCLAMMINSPSGVVLLPMFAGADWNKMSLAASCHLQSLAASASSSTTVANWQRIGSPSRC
jgi:hypothetical protein